LLPVFFDIGNLQNRRNSQKQSEDSNCSKTTKEEDSGQLIEDEEVVGGRGKISIYKYYIKVSISPTF